MVLIPTKVMTDICFKIPNVQIRDTQTLIIFFDVVPITISELQLQCRNRICVAFQMFLNYNSLSFQSEQPIGRNVEGCHLAISGKPHIPVPVMWKFCIISPWFARFFSILYPKPASDPSRSRLMIGLSSQISFWFRPQIHHVPLLSPIPDYQHLS